MGYSFVGIDHVQLAAPKGCEAEARKFYADVLGWDEVEKPPVLKTRGGVWFQCGMHQVHIGVEEGFRPAKKAHPAFRVAGLEQLQAHLQQRGIQVIVDTERVAEGISRCYVEDPFGNRLELME